MQNINTGRVFDLADTYGYAFNLTAEELRMIDTLAKAHPDNKRQELMIYEDGKSLLASDTLDKLLFLGHLDGLIIGIAKCDPPEYTTDTAESRTQGPASEYFEPTKNKLTYFQRMMILQNVLTPSGFDMTKSIYRSKVSQQILSCI